LLFAIFYLLWYSAITGRGNCALGITVCSQTFSLYFINSVCATSQLNRFGVIVINCHCRRICLVWRPFEEVLQGVLCNCIYSQAALAFLAGNSIEGLSSQRIKYLWYWKMFQVKVTDLGCICTSFTNICVRCFEKMKFDNSQNKLAFRCCPCMSNIIKICYFIDKWITCPLHVHYFISIYTCAYGQQLNVTAVQSIKQLQYVMNLTLLQSVSNKFCSKLWWWWQWRRQRK
jgi:hypothetical protein